MGKIYLYLGKRDKKGIKILSVLSGEKVGRARVDDVKKLHLPPDIEIALIKTIHEHHMMWEVWIEEANDFEELKSKLHKRGYRDIPMHPKQLHPLRQFYDANKRNKIKPDTSFFQNKNKTMLERNSLSSSNTNLGNGKRTIGGFNH
jgi:hypothetical protein